MAESRSMNVYFVPQRWFARSAHVVRYMIARYTWVESGERAGEEPRFAYAVARNELLERFQVGFADGRAALEAAGLTPDDEIAMYRRRS